MISKKKTLRMTVCAFLFAVLMICCMPRQASAASVSRSDRVKIQKMLRKFDGYFGYSCATGTSFKFNDYTKSMMIYAYLNNPWQDLSLSRARKVVNRQMKSIFGSGKARFHAFKGYNTRFVDASHLYENDHGKMVYRMGDWGEEYPVGKISRVVKKKSVYTVTYRIRWYSDYYKKYEGDMGTFKVTMKKSKNKYGFMIKNIKRTKTSNINL